MKKIEPNNEIIIYEGDNGEPNIEVRIENETVWLTIDQMAELFEKARSTINEHILNIYAENELVEQETIRKIGNSDFSTKPTNYYNLDVIISVGYRVKSIQGTKFRQWATARLREYLVQGFTMNDEFLKNNGGGLYFKKLLARIRDIRSSEKMLYRQVLDLYATSMDYDPKSLHSVKFFKIVQNKLHYATHKQTATEVIYSRADSNKEFMGLTTFSGDLPILEEVRIAKNYLNEKELDHLNRIVTMYLDFAEMQAQRGILMRMNDWVSKLDAFLKFNERQILSDAGKVSHEVAEALALKEYEKFRKEQDKNYISDFDREVKKLLLDHRNIDEGGDMEKKKRNNKLEE